MQQAQATAPARAAARPGVTSVPPVTLAPPPRDNARAAGWPSFHDRHEDRDPPGHGETVASRYFAGAWGRERPDYMKSVFRYLARPEAQPQASTTWPAAMPWPGQCHPTSLQPEGIRPAEGRPTALPARIISPGVSGSIPGLAASGHAAISREILLRMEVDVGQMR